MIWHANIAETYTGDRRSFHPGPAARNSHSRSWSPDCPDWMRGSLLRQTPWVSRAGSPVRPQDGEDSRLLICRLEDLRVGVEAAAILRVSFAHERLVLITRA